jgi:hypothetical protein
MQLVHNIQTSLVAVTVTLSNLPLRRMLEAIIETPFSLPTNLLEVNPTLKDSTVAQDLAQQLNMV